MIFIGICGLLQGMFQSQGNKEDLNNSLYELSTEALTLYNGLPGEDTTCNPHK